MGRPERILDPDSGPVARFAFELRALRQQAGSPSYRLLATKANYSAAVLSRAAAGRELGSLPVVLAYIAACGGDRDEWRGRWQEVAAQVGVFADKRDAAGAAEDAGVFDAEDPAPGAEIGEDAGWDVDSETGRYFRGLARRLVWRRRPRFSPTALVILLSVAFAGGAVTASLAAQPASAVNARQASTLLKPSPTVVATLAAVSDGNDPKESGCSTGAVTVAQAQLRLPSAVVVGGALQPAGENAGLVELRYSAACHAAWARVTPADTFNVPTLGSVTVVIARPLGDTSATFHYGRLVEVFGDLLRTDGGCVTASATFTLTGGPAVSATTPCWSGR